MQCLQVACAKKGSAALSGSSSSTLCRARESLVIPWRIETYELLVGSGDTQRQVGASTFALQERGWREELRDRAGREEPLQRDSTAYARVAAACKTAKSVSEGKRVHDLAVRSGLERDVFVGNSLINMYGKCGSHENARRIFDKMSERNVVSWNVMIGAYAQHGCGEEAFKLFRRMQIEGVKPNKVTFISMLSACSDPSAMAENMLIHACIIERGLESDVVVGNAIVNMYGKCGNLQDARRVFEKMPQRDVVSWTAMIAAYARHGDGKDALQLSRKMQQAGITPNRITFVAMLTACLGPPDLAAGRLIHARITQRVFEWDVLVGNAILNMYGKCGSLEDARRLFNKMPERDLVSWNAMIAAYVRHGQDKEAFQLFCQMQLQGRVPNKITFSIILNSCSGNLSLPEGRFIHACIVERAFEADVVVGTAIVDMYGKCGNLEDARRIFDHLRQRNVVSWNAMISAYAQNGHLREALELFFQMQVEGMTPDKITFLAILNGCSPEALPTGRLIHSFIAERGFESDVVVANAIVNFYGKCGSLEDARRMFDKILHRDVVSWTSMIATYAQHGQGKMALQLFKHMRQEGVVPDKIAFMTVLDACASMVDLTEGKLIHVLAVQRGVELDVIVGNAIVNMYGKCGSVEDARRIFDNMPERDVVSWSNMIAAYAQQGYGKEALQLFEVMQFKNVIPDDITFLSILSACSHAGLVEEGHHYFISMSKDFCMTPTAEHYACMIDLLGRAGRLHEAENFINRMPFEPGLSAWMSFLGACRIHDDVERGKHAVEHVLAVDPENAATYVCLSNINAAAGRWDAVADVRKVMADRGMRKERGHSFIEVNNCVHEFVVGG